jgi:hypothetical protein
MDCVERLTVVEIRMGREGERQRRNPNEGDFERQPPARKEEWKSKEKEELLRPDGNREGDEVEKLVSIDRRE